MKVKTFPTRADKVREGDLVRIFGNTYVVTEIKPYGNFPADHIEFGLLCVESARTIVLYLIVPYHHSIKACRSGSRFGEQS